MLNMITNSCKNGMIVNEFFKIFLTSRSQTISAIFTTSSRKQYFEQELHKRALSIYLKFL